MSLKSTSIILAVGLTCCVCFSEVHAATACANEGETDPVDPSVPPKIIAWVQRVEPQVGLVMENWHGLPAEAPTPEQRRLLTLQGIAAKWVFRAPEGTVERFFRSAVEHALSVEYESMMVREDPAQAKQHKFWVDVESARTMACLAMIRQP